MKTRNMRKPFAVLIALVMLLSMQTIAPAAMANDADEVAAIALNRIGLFRGLGDDAEGRPIFDLGGDVLRLHGLIMLVRLMGAEAEAQGSDYDLLFEDVPEYAAGYVSYAFVMGWTKGRSDTEFDPDSNMDATQYLTFLLRALGYEDGADFEWDAAWDLTDEIGITSGEYNAGNNSLLRGDMARLSLITLTMPMKGTEQTLIEHLIDGGVFEKLAEEGLIKDEAVLDALEKGNIDTFAELIKAIVTEAAGDMADPGGNGNENPGEDIVPSEIGMYDPDYDYFANPRYKVAYVVSNNLSGIYTASSNAFAHWASLMNIDYSGLIDFSGNNAQFFSQLPLIAREHDGLLMEADATMHGRVYEIMKQEGKPWQSFMGAASDYSLPDEPLMNAYLGLDNYVSGHIAGEYLLECALEYWPNVPLTEFGFITVDYSSVPPLHDREVGARDAITALNPDMAANRYFVADTAAGTGGFSTANSRVQVRAVLNNNPEIEYWLVWASLEDMAVGAALALELTNLADNSFVTSIGGFQLVEQWDNNVQTAWKSSFFLPDVVFTEPVIGSLYAYMNGDATPETIFPEWQNKNESKHYGSFPTRTPPLYEIRFETYKHILAWSDVYAGSNFYTDYPRDGITRDTYPNTAPIPESYK